MDLWRGNRYCTRRSGVRRWTPDLFEPVLCVARSARDGSLVCPNEDQVGAAPVAIISTRLWQRRYGANPRVVGMPLIYDGKTYTVIGVAPRGLQLDGDADVFTPLGQATEPRSNGALHISFMLWHAWSRRHSLPGASRIETDECAACKTISGFKHRHSLVPHPLQSELVQDVRPTLWLLLSAVSLVLLIACVNVASLLLTRVYLAGTNSLCVWH